MAAHTINEILSQPDIWRTVSDYIEEERHRIKDYLENCRDRTLVFVGCGSSYYLALTAANVYSKITGEEAKGVSSSDILFFPELIFPQLRGGYASMLISRSGATTEVLRAGKIIKKEMKFPTCALTCRENSELLAYGEFQFVLDKADEKSVVMTRSFTSMLLLIQYLVAIKENNQTFFKELSLLPEKGASVIENYRSLVEEIMNDFSLSKYVYLGQGPYYGMACESMLKIKEMSNASAEAFHSLEYRHGPMSTADDQTLITFFLSDNGRDEEMKLVKEMSKLGPKTLVLCDYSDEDIKKYADYVVELKSESSEFARLILCMPITQLMGYYKSISNGLDPDNPRNLSSVVTLE